MKKKDKLLYFRQMKLEKDYIVYSMNWKVETLNNETYYRIVNNFKAQRDNWDFKKKSRFIESLILGLPVPQIVFLTRGSGFDCLDGWRRLITIQQFYKNDFRLEGLEFLPKINGLSYEDFEFNEGKDALDNQPIRMTIIKNVSDDNTLLNISQRLNLPRSK